MKKVLVLIPAEERHKKQLEAAGAGCEFVYVTHKELTAEMVQSADVIIGNPRPSFLAASEKLGLLQLESAGADMYVKEGLLSRNTALTNSTGAYSQAVAEHAFAVTLMLQKKLHLYRDDQNRAVWGNRGMISSISDSTVLVVGLGDIGLYYARMAKLLGAKVIGLKRRMSDCPEYVDELYITDELKSVLPRADIVVSILPGTPATTHIFSDECFDLMKDSAIFMNFGRGNSVATDVIYRALTEKKIAAAALDVTEVEPLPADSPLWQLENLVITPHVAGGYHLAATLDRIVGIASRNLEAFLAGRPLENIVDLSTGYKK